MFETDAKKSLRVKYNRMSSAKKNNGDFSLINQPPGSVYGELKLSEKLDSELRKVKQIVDTLNEELEEKKY